jgi:hypothetical protein
MSLTSTGSLPLVPFGSLCSPRKHAPLLHDVTVAVALCLLVLFALGVRHSSACLALSPACLQNPTNTTHSKRRPMLTPHPAKQAPQRARAGGRLRDSFVFEVLSAGCRRSVPNKRLWARTTWMTCWVRLLLWSLAVEQRSVLFRCGCSWCFTLCWVCGCVAAGAIVVVCCSHRHREDDLMDETKGSTPAPAGRGSGVVPAAGVATGA